MTDVVWLPPERAGARLCVDQLATVLGRGPGEPHSTAVFLLDCAAVCDAGGHALPWHIDASASFEVAHRLRRAAPTWHRLLRSDEGAFLVVVQGMVDGRSVLGTAARLVHAFDDALHALNLADCIDPAIGIAVAPPHGARADALLAAAAFDLRDSMAFARSNAQTCLRPSEMPDSVG